MRKWNFRHILKLSLGLPALLALSACEEGRHQSQSIWLQSPTDREVSAPTGELPPADLKEDVPALNPVAQEFIDNWCRGTSYLSLEARYSLQILLDLTSTPESCEQGALELSLMEELEIDMTDWELESLQDLWPIGSLSQLKSLKISGNDWSSLPQSSVAALFLPLFKLHQLESLDLSNNNLFSIRGLSRHRPDLRHLNLAQNRLGLMDPTEMTLDRFYQLESLDLSDNEMESLPFIPRSVTELRLAHNLLSSMESYVGLWSHPSWPLWSNRNQNPSIEFLDLRGQLREKRRVLTPWVTRWVPLEESRQQELKASLEGRLPYAHIRIGPSNHRVHP